MVFKLLLATVLALSTALCVVNAFSNPYECGTTKRFRIRDGKYPNRDPTKCEQPWVAYIRSKQLKCAGVIVGPRHILTTAHCVQPENRASVPPASEFTVYTGDSNRKMGTQRVVQRAVVHDSYDRHKRNDDIAMLILRDSIKYDQCNRPICVYSNPRTPEENKYCKMVGWGATQRGGPMIDNLKIGTSTRAKSEFCKDQYPDLFNDKTFCAEPYHQSSACTGDDGGPYICQDGDRFYLSGIMAQIRGSWCGLFWPFYTNVNYYIPWIQRNMR